MTLFPKAALACALLTTTVVVAGPIEASQLVNFHQVNATLYRSGEITEPAIEELRELGVRTIVSLHDYGGDRLRAEREQRWARQAGMSFRWLPMNPFLRPSVAQVETALAAIVSAADTPVLVHCQRGADRTGIVVAAYRMRYEGWSQADAKAELRSLGHSRALYWWDGILDDFALDNDDDDDEGLPLALAD